MPANPYDPGKRPSTRPAGLERPLKGADKRPPLKIEIREEEKFNPSILGVLVALVLVGGAAAFGVLRWTERHDPHYLKAQEIIEAYEMGKEIAARDYEHQAYQVAIKELEMVDPTSISAEPAKNQIAFLRERIAEQRNRAVKRRQEQEHLALQKQKRNQAFFAMQQRERLQPPSDYPECEKEEGGHDTHGH